VVDEFSLRAFKDGFIVFSPLYRNLCRFVEDADVLEWGFSRSAEVSVINKAVTPTYEYPNVFEAVEEVVDGDEEDNNRQC
jgi:hypothetical protein